MNSTLYGTPFKIACAGPGPLRAQGAGGGLGGGVEEREGRKEEAGEKADPGPPNGEGSSVEQGR